jgi:GTP-binding protein
VSARPGTTRDAIDVEVDAGGRRVIVIDTAGIRRHANQGLALEYFSTLRAIAAIGRCDVALLMIDAVTGVTAQDRRIAGLAIEEGKALAIMLNKWDLVNATADRDEIERRLRTDFAFAPYVPILYGSALTKKGLPKVWATVFRIFDERRKRVATAKLNQLVHDAFRLHPPGAFRGRELKCHYVTQSDVAPPEFVFFVNDPRLVHFSYERYLENVIRESFGFEGTPLRFVFRTRVRQDTKKAEDVVAAARADEERR